MTIGKKKEGVMMITLIIVFVVGSIFGNIAAYKLLDPDKTWEEGFEEGRKYEREHGEKDN